MNAVFKDGRGRVLDGLIGVRLENADAWLGLRPDAAVCDVYEADNRVRGELVATFVRDAESGRWLPQEPPNKGASRASGR
jgi:hypothetical protein